MVNQTVTTEVLTATSASTPEKNAKPANVITTKSVSIFGLYRYASNTDRIILGIGALAAVAQGGSIPALSLLFGAILNELGTQVDDFTNKVNELALWQVVTGIVTFVAAASSNFCFNLTAKNLSTRLKCKYFEKLLDKDVGWMDKRRPGEISAAMADDIAKVEAAVGIKMMLFILNCTMGILGIAIGLARGWQVCLVMFAAIPFLAGSAYWFGTILSSEGPKQREAYAKAGAVAVEVLSAIRTVVSFGAEQREISRYSSFLDDVRKRSLVIDSKSGIAMTLMLSIYRGALHGVAFYTGGRMIYGNITNTWTSKIYTGGDVVAVLFLILTAGFALGQTGPLYRNIMEGCVAAGPIYAVIDEKSSIESPLVAASLELRIGKQRKSEKVALVVESIALKNVSFFYPARPEIQVLNSLSLEIVKGQKVALVGESGSGKSTVISLLERFYDPHQGEVQINGQNIVSLFPHAREDLRRLFGYVGQEPVLFATSIYGNLTYGLPSSQMPTQEEIEAVCQKCNVWDFITMLPEGLQTYCGAAGASQLSGGQKQRLAIARAILGNPQILLFDEATSALDSENEKLVQNTLDELRKSEGGLTTVSVAHRLSTIRNSDKIFVLQRGALAEEGTHFSLMERKGVYYSLVNTQEAALQGGGTDRKSSKEIAAKFAEASKLRQPMSVGNHVEEDKDEDEREKKRAEEIKKTFKTPWKRLFSFNRREAWVYIPGLLGAVIYGSQMPLLGYLMSVALGGIYKSDREEMLDSIENSTLLFVYASIFTFVGAVVYSIAFAYLGGWFTLRVRKLCFGKFLEQSIDFHDDPHHSPGRLGAALQTWSVKMTALSGINLGIYLHAMSALVVGVILAFTASPALAGVMSACIPFLAVASTLEALVFLNVNAAEGGDGARATLIIDESLRNLKTVRAASAEQVALCQYQLLLKIPLERAKKKLLLGALGFGFSQMSYFLVFSLGFWYGGVLIKDGLNFEDFNKALNCIIFGAFGIGQAAASLPDVGEALVAAHDVFEVLDSKSRINALEAQKMLEDPSHKKMDEIGHIQFKNVSFEYPNRPGLKILNNLSFSVKRGQKVALVGPSGGGKSTVMALFQRFYDPLSESTDLQVGEIAVNGQPLKQMNVAEWRSRLGYVGQEPVLFDMSLEDNVKYGNPQAAFEEVEAASRQANMTDFISRENAENQNSVGWSERLGPGGSLLSGGQKQRTAIARALVIAAEVLLLDEATSALDSESEKVVQMAIDNLRSSDEKRTMIVIAHRLSTIVESDVIFVISEGRVVESGTHAELLANHGVYCDLYNAASF